ncbi:dUTP pyrophosphatase [Novimethylophilus kurashikiensis]|uniref:dUTP pyrophosphatase n=1 Tax=Novimethylophilus kurashikiensis TaxID=1825523 RepID=A0A2R5F8P8_9PROT|nr:hypothetical protein [Novimethylophilus kurashikiensis]GBG14606.1 dUTP pyrophosphatase [Novimethylophilus kurashikiensis]
MRDIGYEIHHPLAGAPVMAERGGVELRAAVDVPVVLRYGKRTQLIQTGMRFNLPGDVMALVLPGSGVARRMGLMVDAEVTQVNVNGHPQWAVTAWNGGPSDELVINPGDVVARVLFLPVVNFSLSSQQAATPEPVSILNHDAPLF